MGFKLLREVFGVFLTVYLNFQELPDNHYTINDHNTEWPSGNGKKSEVNITFGKKRSSRRSRIP